MTTRKILLLIVAYLSVVQAYNWPWAHRDQPAEDEEATQPEEQTESETPEISEEEVVPVYP